MANTISEKKETRQVMVEQEVVVERTLDITDDLMPELGREGGFIRLYLIHNGNVILRAGLDKNPALTSYAEANGYSLVTGRMGLRGAFFKVYQTVQFPQ